MKSKTLLVSTLLLASSVVVAAPAQAHDSYNDLWPLYGLTGLILLDSYSYHHHPHRYYDAPRYRHGHVRDYSYGRPVKHGHHYDDRDRGRHR